ncbi:unnamed protein product [Cuscuta campestris]|uniref:Uncharacterized protein n=1 Tax=Cuscuta campestris TaxID=132261 RepID=A0A484MPR1_9ASTE|nr:unnamed protein product [Cuscuta campestris]
MRWKKQPGRPKNLCELSTLISSTTNDSAAGVAAHRRSPFPSQPSSPSLQPLFHLRWKSAIIADELQRRHAERWTSPELPASFLAVDCSAASRCSPPSSCRYATVAGVRHRRRIRPLPRVDIAGRLTSTPD